MGGWIAATAIRAMLAKYACRNVLLADKQEDDNTRLCLVALKSLTYV